MPNLLNTAIAIFALLTSELLTVPKSIHGVAFGAPAPREILLEKRASNLELIRNQMELLLSNQATLARDLTRQKREQDGLALFLRIPLPEGDPKDHDIIRSIREDLAKTGLERGYRVASVTFAGKWKSRPNLVPSQIAFDEPYSIPDDQIADTREVKLEIDFPGPMPGDAKAWLFSRQQDTRRLIYPLSERLWKKTKKHLSARALIFRFRKLRYPEMVAADLSRYEAPLTALAPTEQRIEKRIRTYKSDIVRLWPLVQPHLANFRKFAINDLRMSFFLKHLNNNDEHHH